MFSSTSNWQAVPGVVRRAAYVLVAIAFGA